MTEKLSRFILVTEDDEDHYFLLQLALQKTGLQWELIRVKDGVDLLHTLQTLSRLPDLILLDLNLPKKDGRTALKEIKEEPKLASIPVAVLTTSINSEDEKNSYVLGASFYFKKPIGFNDFVDLLHTIEEKFFTSYSPNA